MLRRYGVEPGDADDELCCIDVTPPPVDEADLSVLLDVDDDEDPLPEPVEPDETK